MFENYWSRNFIKTVGKPSFYENIRKPLDMHSSQSQPHVVWKEGVFSI